jgi:cytochrome b6-f complex iron-sulfur subunit
MSTGAVVAIAVVVLAFLAVVLIVGSFRRRDTDQALGELSRETLRRDRPFSPTAESGEAPTGKEIERVAALERRPGGLATAERGEVAVWVPPDPEVIDIARRQFLNRSIVTMMLVAIGGFGASVIGFLWPSSSGGFGSKISLGKIADIEASIAAGHGFFYVPEGRMWVTAYPASALPKAKQVYAQPVLVGMQAGIVALYQKCVHLGCRVPSCLTSQWFECPCHGSQYNRVGEKKGGPAPRGLDRFTVDASGGTITVNTGQIIQGPPIGTNTTGQEAEGPHCISGGH